MRVQVRSGAESCSQHRCLIVGNQYLRQVGTYISQLALIYGLCVGTWKQCHMAIAERLQSVGHLWGLGTLGVATLGNSKYTVVTIICFETDHRPKIFQCESVRCM